jgi:hypothetical protein
LSDLPKAKAVTGRAQTSGGKPAGKPYKRRMRNYLLDKSLQLRYVAFVTVLSAIICGALGYMIYRQENQASAQILETLDGMGDDAYWNEVQQQLGDDLSSRDTELVLTMIGVGIGLVLVLSFYLVVMTHKVAGPLYKVSGYFDKMAAGKLGEVWPLRKGDMLKDFYDKFKATHDTVRARHLEDNERVARLLEACAAAGVARDGTLGSALDQLEQHHQARDQALS